MRKLQLQSFFFLLSNHFTAVQCINTEQEREERERLQNVCEWKWMEKKTKQKHAICIDLFVGWAKRICPSLSLSLSANCFSMISFCVQFHFWLRRCCSRIKRLFLCVDVKMLYWYQPIAIDFHEFRHSKHSSCVTSYSISFLHLHQPIDHRHQSIDSYFSLSTRQTISLHTYTQRT